MGPDSHPFDLCGHRIDPAQRSHRNDATVELTDQATARVRQGRYEEALPLAQQALSQLEGSGETYEGYANYNVGRSLIELGNCAEGLPHIDRSEQIQGSRPEFDQARAKC